MPDRVWADHENFHKSKPTTDGGLYYWQIWLIRNRGRTRERERQNQQSMIAHKHILGTFDEALGSLRNNVLMMAGLAERSLERAMRGLTERDDDICANAIADDEEIDQLEMQIDKDGMAILLRFQPVASDLRRVVAAMKLSNNLERMADQGTTIARRARKLSQHPPLPEVELMRPLYEQAMSMFKDSVDAFVREDVDLGCAVVTRDEKLDELTHEASGKL